LDIREKEAFELIRTMRDIAEIEPDAVQKTRILDSVRDLMAILLPKMQREIRSLIENDRGR